MILLLAADPAIAVYYYSRRACYALLLLVECCYCSFLFEACYCFELVVVVDYDVPMGGTTELFAELLDDVVVFCCDYLADCYFSPITHKT